MRIYNCHTHIFTLEDTPEGFLKYGLGFLPDWALELLKRLVLKKWLARLALKLLRKPYAVKGLSFHLVGLLSTSTQVFRNLQKFYPPGSRFVVLPLNFAHVGLGDLKVPYKQQLDELIQVKRSYPNECLLFIHIDPREDTAEKNRDFIEKYLERGFSGIKMYTPLGYFPFDPNLEKVYELAEEKEVPIISHCSQGGIFFAGKELPESFLKPKSFNPQPEGKYDFAPAKNEVFCDYFVHPDRYIDVLEKFPKLKLCFAHFGWDTIEHRSKRVYNRKELYEGVKKLLLDEKYPNVYADISYSLFDKKFSKQLKQDFEAHPQLQDQVVFGTDYFMTLQEKLTEDQLYKGFRSDMGEAIFTKLAYENPKRFLTSAYYIAG